MVDMANLLWRERAFEGDREVRAAAEEERVLLAHELVQCVAVRYARGTSMREMQDFPLESYGVEASLEFIGSPIGGTGFSVEMARRP